MSAYASQSGGSGKTTSRSTARTQPPDQMAVQHPARAMSHQVVIAQTVDHQQDERASRAQRRHVEVPEWRIGQGRGPAGVGHAAHEVEDASTVVIRQREIGFGG